MKIRVRGVQVLVHYFEMLTIVKEARKGGEVCVRKKTTDGYTHARAGLACSGRVPRESVKPQQPTVRTVLVGCLTFQGATSLVER